jgi:serine/threonine-protein kinase HipA
MNCLVCLRQVNGGHYHLACARRLFGSARVPEIQVERAKLQTSAPAMVGRTTFSGAQEKLSLGYAVDRTRLVVETDHAQFILKPQQTRFSSLPENEHVTMLIARRLRIEIPACGLVRLTDGSLAYLIRRFDREGGKKRRVEDFCQLAEKSPADKYDGSAELCVRLVRGFASEPLVDILGLFRRQVFSFWTGNGDMHLKNFALLAGFDGRHALSPAYDLVCTQLVIPDDQQALPIGGKRARLKKRDFQVLAKYAGLTPRAAEPVLAEHVRREKDVLSLIERSFLDQADKRVYSDLIRQNTQSLSV